MCMHLHPDYHYKNYMTSTWPFFITIKLRELILPFTEEETFTFLCKYLRFALSSFLYRFLSWRVFCSGYLVSACRMYQFLCELSWLNSWMQGEACSRFCMHVCAYLYRVLQCTVLTRVCLPAATSLSKCSDVYAVTKHNVCHILPCHLSVVCHLSLCCWLHACPSLIDSGQVSASLAPFPVPCYSTPPSHSWRRSVALCRVRYAVLCACGIALSMHCLCTVYALSMQCPLCAITPL